MSLDIEVEVGVIFWSAGLLLRVSIVGCLSLACEFVARFELDFGNRVRVWNWSLKFKLVRS